MRRYIVIFLLTLPSIVRAQLLIGKHYVDDSVNSLTFLQFNADMTFQYSYAYDLMNDHATGKYALIKDTVLLKYDYVQEPIILDGGLSSHTEYNRADTLLIKKHKLFQIKNGVSMEYAPPIVYDLKKNKRKPPKSWHYKRKYLLFGPYQSQSKNSYYMIDEQYAVWATRKWRKRHPSG